jgi:ABC-2 type transport system permease protein
MNATYIRMEILRTFRNRRFFIFSLVFPLVFFYLIAGANRTGTLGGISFAAYYLAGMTSFGTMAAMLANGGRIAGERSVGWNRQLRMTPLNATSYFGAKLIASYLMAGLTLLLLLVGGLTLGVHEQLLGVLKMAGYIAVGLIPFAAFGVLIGHKFTTDAIGPILGGGTSILAFVGGAWGPFGGDSGFMHDLSQATPTYWLVQAGHTLIGGAGWTSRGWLTIAIWSAVLGRLAMMAYATDTKRQ